MAAAAASVNIPDNPSLADRAVLVTQIPNIAGDSEELGDKLEIYFGKRKNGGGEVEQVITPFGRSKRNALVVFESSSGNSFKILFEGIKVPSPSSRFSIINKSSKRKCAYL